MTLIQSVLAACIVVAAASARAPAPAPRSEVNADRRDCPASMSARASCRDETLLTDLRKLPGDLASARIKAV